MQEPVDTISLSNATMLSRLGLTYEFVIHGDIRLIIKELAELPITDITIPEPGLEEIFIHFYKDHNHA